MKNRLKIRLKKTKTVSYPYFKKKTPENVNRSQKESYE